MLLLELAGVHHLDLLVSLFDIVNWAVLIIELVLVNHVTGLVTVWRNVVVLINQMLSLPIHGHLLLRLVLDLIFLLFLIFLFIFHVHDSLHLVDDFWFMPLIHKVLLLLIILIFNFVFALDFILIVSLHILLSHVVSQLLELIVLHLLLEHLLFGGWLGLFFLSFAHLHLTVVDAFLFLVLHLAVLYSLVVVVSLIVLHLLAINWHLLLVLVLLLEHQQLLLLRLIQDINATLVVGWRWDALREVSELIQLVEVLSTLDQDLLIIVQVVVRVNVGVTKKITVLLEVLDLIIEVDEFLSLLLYK